MKINLEQIKASPKPIRTTWDEEKLNELAESIKEQGMIVPIKVRPSNGKYEIVYGHRRVEAARRAGLDEIECIVEGMENTDTLVQALIENIMREDMNAYDTAKALKNLKDTTGWSNKEIANKFGWKSEGSVANYLTVLGGEIEDVVKLHHDEVSEQHVMQVKAAIKDEKTAASILKKVAKEGLNRSQTRNVAESIAATQDPHRREALLNTPYSSFIHDPNINRERAERYGAYDPLTIPNKISPGEEWMNTTEVKVLLDYLQSSLTMAAKAIHMDELGKFAPEARPFIARKTAKMIEVWQKVIEKLESEK